MSKYKVEVVDILSIHENESNPRVIKDDKFKKLVESIRTFPQMLELRPIVVNADGEILGGNMRYKACMELNMEKIPVVQVADLTPEQQAEFIIKDNVGFGEWDWDMLANEWEQTDLSDWGLDFPHFQTDYGIEATGRKAATLDEKLDTYLNASIKQIVLYYEIEEYEKVLQSLDRICEDANLEDNSSAIQFLIASYEKK